MSDVAYKMHYNCSSG